VAEEVLLTGSSGRIGTALRRLLPHVPWRAADLREGLDLADPGVAEAAVRGCRAVVHLAANPSQHAGYEELRRPNLDAAARVMGAAARAGVARLVFASSVHVSGEGRPAGPEAPVRPCCPYGATKAFGEALARHHADADGMATVCLRIGWFRETPEAVAALPPERRGEAVTARDLARLVDLSLTREVGFAILYAVSGWPGGPYDLTRAREILGYRPQDGEHQT
jgi:nucleoside-diphosphate-sugar epimerase